MKKFEGILSIITIFLIFVFLLMACGQATCVDEGIQESESIFIEVKESYLYEVVYHRTTKVMYVVSSGLYNRGTFTLLVNADGTPMLWEDK